MNNTKIESGSWVMALAAENNSTSDEVWESGFEVDRQVVHSKLGPYKKIFLRPDNFVKRFYHTVYPLSIEEWQCTDQAILYDGFCTIDVVLDVRFQPTFNYAVSNIELLSELNEHIKNAYHDIAFDLVNRELLNLSDGAWIHKGLEPAEKRICSSINEMLILQNIQSEVTCKLTPSFEEFPDVQFAKESVYLTVLKKSFEFNEQERKELFRQEQQEEKQRIEHKRIKLQQLNEQAELDREKQMLLADNNKTLLEEKAQQQLEQYEVKKKLHADKVEHISQLKEIDLRVEIHDKEKEYKLLRENEEQEKAKVITHQAKLKEKELAADIVKYEKKQASWRKAKDKSHTEDLGLKHKQKQLEFDTDVGYKRRYEEQRLAMQEESFSARKKADVYLRREIELLELEKQRLELTLAIKASKEKQASHLEEDDS